MRYIPFLLAFLILLPIKLYADVEVQLLVEDLPLIGANPDLATLLVGLFRLTLGIAVTAAIVVIVFNGIHYMASDAVGGKEGAKKWITEALIGLVFAFSVVLILDTINPNLTKFDFLTSLTRLGGTAPVIVPPGGGDTEPPTDSTEADLRARLREAGIGVNKPACTTPGQTNCTNVAGLPESAISRLIALKEACGCGGFTITGGTENGHATHGVGRPMLDLRRDSGITRFIQTQGTFLRDTDIGKLYSYNGNEFLDETGGSPHWHACMGTSCAISN